MSERDIFNTPEEEVKKLVDEIRGVKEMLGDLSRRLSHIETRVVRAFPSMRSKLSPPSKSKTRVVERVTTLTPEQALSIYDELVAQAAKEDIDSVRERLSGFILSDLNLIRQELGVTLGKKKSSKKSLIESIIHRISESIKLSQHVNRKELIENTINKDLSVQKAQLERRTKMDDLEISVQQEEDAIRRLSAFVQKEFNHSLVELLKELKIELENPNLVVLPPIEWVLEKPGTVEIRVNVELNKTDDTKLVLKEAYVDTGIVDVFDRDCHEKEIIDAIIARWDRNWRPSIKA